MISRATGINHGRLAVDVASRARQYPLVIRTSDLLWQADDLSESRFS
jgi:hypothetical protein